MLHVTSIVPGVAWPAIPTPRGSQLLAIQFQLEQSQWLSAEHLREQQKQQVGRILDYAYQYVPFYRQRLDEHGLRPQPGFGESEWRKIPLLTRRDIQAAGKSLYSTHDLKEHGPRSECYTSGSSGSPVMTIGTSVTRLLWTAITLRQHIWHQRNLSGKLASIRSLDDDSAKEWDNWGAATCDVVKTGPAVAIDISTPVDEQVAWLAEQVPDVLMTYPTNAAAIASYSREHGVELPSLKEVRTFGELLQPDVRELIGEIWEVPVTDVYSCQELGYIALQCPKSEAYHVQSEVVLVEVLDEHGNECKPGETGRVVLTTLQNFAMPLLRYDIGDFAEVGEPCLCGRGLPVLRRIVGRQRNMAILPNGKVIWPCTGAEFRRPEIAESLPPIQQFQIIQTAPDTVDAYLVAPRIFTADEEEAVRTAVQSSFGWPMQVVIKYTEQIQRGPGGKYEDYRCDVPAEEVARLARWAAGTIHQPLGD